MPFCVKCGVRVADGQQFCAACEAKSNPLPVCAKCGTPYASPNAKFCMACGTIRQAPTAVPPAAPNPGMVIPPPVAPPSMPKRPPQPPATPQAAPLPPRPPAETGQVCPRCGKPIKVGQAKFCIYCAAPLSTASTPPAPARPGPAMVPPTPPKAPSPEPAARLPLSAQQQTVVDAETQNRFDIYRTLGRQLLSICRGNPAVKDQLPDELAREIDQAAAALQNGHNRLARAGICPRCQDTALHPDTNRCPACGLTIAK